MIGHRPDRKSLRIRASALVCGLWIACAETPDDHLAQARSALADADYAQALAEAEAGLAGAPDERAAWGLELVVLEAQARSGRGEGATGQLRQLAERHPDRLPPSQYAATADQLRSAGDGEAAIEVLDLGFRRHPDDPLLARLIGDAQSGEVAPAELELLRSLGYIDSGD